VLWGGPDGGGARNILRQVRELRMGCGVEGGLSTGGREDRRRKKTKMGMDNLADSRATHPETKDETQGELREKHHYGSVGGGRTGQSKHLFKMPVHVSKNETKQAEGGKERAL